MKCTGIISINTNKIQDIKEVEVEEEEIEEEEVVTETVEVDVEDTITSNINKTIDQWLNNIRSTKDKINHNQL